jgi:hypothetical protein
VSPGLELLVQFVGTVSNPFVIGASLAMPFFWPRPLAVRFGAVATAATFGAMDAIIGSAVLWGLAIVAVSVAGGLVVAQVALLVLLPLAAVMISLARGAVQRFKQRR